MVAFDKLVLPAGLGILRSAGTDQGSTVTAQPVVMRTPRRSSESHIELYLAVRLSSLDGKEGLPESQLSIVVPTLQAARGIFQAASAYILNTASLAQSNGESHE